MSLRTSIGGAAAALGTVLLLIFPSVAFAQTQCPISGICGGCVGDLHCYQFPDPAYPPGGGPCPGRGSSTCYDLLAAACLSDRLSVWHRPARGRLPGLRPALGQPLSFAVRLRIKVRSRVATAHASIRDTRAEPSRALVHRR